VHADSLVEMRALASIKDVKITDADNALYETFAIVVPEAWQREMVESGVFHEVNKLATDQENAEARRQAQLARKQQGGEERSKFWLFRRRLGSGKGGGDDTDDGTEGSEDGEGEGELCTSSPRLQRLVGDLGNSRVRTGT